MSVWGGVVSKRVRDWNTKVKTASLYLFLSHILVPYVKMYSNGNTFLDMKSTAQLVETVVLCLLCLWRSFPKIENITLVMSSALVQLGLELIYSRDEHRKCKGRKTCNKCTWLESNQQLCSYVVCILTTCPPGHTKAIKVCLYYRSRMIFSWVLQLNGSAILNSWSAVKS